MTGSTHKQILFIHNDPRYIETIRGVLAERGDWSPTFAASAREAFAILSQRPEIVAVAADAELWGARGDAFLGEVRRKFPDVTRLSLPAGQAPPAATVMLPISRGMDTAGVHAVLDRTYNLHQLLTNEAVQHVVGDLTRLPSVPSTYWRLMEAAQKPNIRVMDIAAIIEVDAAMGLKVLQLVNSSFFGLASRVSSISQAVSYVGLELLKGLVLSAHVFSALDGAKTKVLALERFQLYSIRVGRLAQRFASNKQAAEEAFTAGIIHNVGELVLAVQQPAAFGRMLQRVAETSESRIVVERELFGATHAEVGAQLLSNWGIPFPIVECTAFHHEPSRVAGGDVEVLATVHAADALAGILSCGEPEETLDSAFLERAGMRERLPGWRKLAQKEAAAWAEAD